MWARVIWGVLSRSADRARDAQHAAVAARGQVHALGRAQQQLAAARIGRCDPIEQLPVRYRRLR
jgi:hypothetical protein